MPLHIETRYRFRGRVVLIACSTQGGGRGPSWGHVWLSYAISVTSGGDNQRPQREQILSWTSSWPGWRVYGDVGKCARILTAPT